MKKRILIASGGTGGHFYPGYALGKELLKRGWEVLFLVKKDDPALRILQDNGLAAVETDIVSFPRSANPARTILFFRRLISSYFFVRRVLVDWRPDAVAGTGSYVSFPAVFSAWTLNIPSVIHEANARLGLSNRICSAFASGIALGLPVRGLKQDGRFRLTGIPVREFFASPADTARARQDLGLAPGKKTVLVFGGSQGARKLNLAVVKTVKRIIDSGADLQFLHVAGTRDHHMVAGEYGSAGTGDRSRVKLLEYCHEMDKAYAASDIVLSRSGASTIAELIQLKKPAILVPLPSAPGDHQAANARIMEEKGAAVMVRESPELPEKLFSELNRVFSGSSGALERMKSACAGLDIPAPITAAARLADFVIEAADR